jgi:hypothetical protein
MQDARLDPNFFAKYLKSKADKKFAAKCRKAIFDTSGKIVRFPDLPEDKSSTITTESLATNENT